MAGKPYQFLNLDTDGTLSANSDTIVPSQRAIRTYVDSQKGTAPAFANLTGKPSDNAALQTEFDAKQDKLSASDGLIIKNNVIRLADSIDCGAVTGIDGNEWDCGSVL